MRSTRWSAYSHNADCHAWVHAYSLHMAMIFSNGYRSIGNSSERSHTSAFCMLISC